MNKNRKIKRGVTAGIAAGMSFLLGALPVCAADTSVSKDETVYVNADATGSQKQVTVSNWLKNAGLEDTVADESTLEGIKNIKGTETFTETGDTLTWDTDGKDIYYQGTTDKDLPVLSLIHILPYLHSLPQLRSVIHPAFSDSYHADTVPRRWTVARSSPVPQADPAAFLQWMPHFSVPHQTSEILRLPVCWLNTRMLQPH